MSTVSSFDPERPVPWQPGGYSQTQRMAEEQRSGMARWPAETRCRYCGESLSKLHGLTPQGHALGWLLRGRGPWCFWCNLKAWDAWKRGLYFGKTELNGY